MLKCSILDGFVYPRFLGLGKEKGKERPESRGSFAEDENEGEANRTKGNAGENTRDAITICGASQGSFCSKAPGSLAEGHARTKSISYQI